MAVDNFAGPGMGNVYLISRTYSFNVIHLYRSIDNGNTFAPTGGTLIVTAENAGVQGPYVAVGPDHSVYAFWFDNRLPSQRIMMANPPTRA